MTNHTWPLEFEQLLRSYLPLLEPDEPVLGDLSLADYGLDSLATVNLLLELEDAFNVMIPDELLVEETFASPSNLWNALAALRTLPPAP